jgi:hypothetical protein
MSISFVTTHPMNLDDAVFILRSLGCTVEVSPDRTAVARDPDRNYFHLTDDLDRYTNLTIDLSTGEMTFLDTKIQDGSTRVMGECYGENDATMMANALNMVSEGEAAFWEITHPDPGG